MIRGAGLPECPVDPSEIRLSLVLVAPAEQKPAEVFVQEEPCQIVLRKAGERHASRHNRGSP